MTRSAAGAAPASEAAARGFSANPAVIRAGSVDTPLGCLELVAGPRHLVHQLRHEFVGFGARKEAADEACRTVVGKDFPRVPACGVFELESHDDSNANAAGARQ